jgi:uncharacterized protein YecA (UPF0149 family)
VADDENKWKLIVENIWIDKISPSQAKAEKLFEVQDINASKKLRPNDPCHCGSGKKFKKCHGKDE